MLLLATSICLFSTAIRLRTCRISACDVLSKHSVFRSPDNTSISWCRACKNPARWACRRVKMLVIMPLSNSFSAVFMLGHNVRQMLPFGTRTTFVGLYVLGVYPKAMLLLSTLTKKPKMISMTLWSSTGKIPSFSYTYMCAEYTPIFLGSRSVIMSTSYQRRI